MPNQFETEQDSIFNSAFSLTINQKLMKKIEKEYLTMKSKKTEDEMEIRVSVAWLLNYKSTSAWYFTKSTKSECSFLSQPSYRTLFSLHHPDFPDSEVENWEPAGQTEDGDAGAGVQWPGRQADTGEKTACWDPVFHCAFHLTTHLYNAADCLVEVKSHVLQIRDLQKDTAILLSQTSAK